MPTWVKLFAALHALGLEPAETEYDHDPALALRPVDPVTGDTIPPANDWRHIVPRTKEAHKAKTFGDHTPLSGDVSKAAKLKDVARKHEDFRRRLLAKDCGEAPREERRKQKIAGRPWPKKGKTHGRSEPTTR